MPLDFQVLTSIYCQKLIKGNVKSKRIIVQCVTMISTPFMKINNQRMTAYQIYKIFWLIFWSYFVAFVGDLISINRPKCKPISIQWARCQSQLQTNVRKQSANVRQQSVNVWQHSSNVRQQSDNVRSNRHPMSGNKQPMVALMIPYLSHFWNGFLHNSSHISNWQKSVLFSEWLIIPNLLTLIFFSILRTCNKMFENYLCI